MRSIGRTDELAAEEEVEKREAMKENVAQFVLDALESGLYLLKQRLRPFFLLFLMLTFQRVVRSRTVLIY